MAEEVLNPTAWGEAALELGDPGTGNTMAETFENIGKVLEETLGVELEDGTVLSLYASGHKLVDMLQQEGVVAIVGTLVGIPESARTRFWKTSKEGNIQWVQSMVTTGKYSVRLGTPRVVGSDRLLVPYSSVNLGFGYAENQGWTAPFRFTVIAGATGNLFGFDTVPTEETPEG